MGKCCVADTPYETEGEVHASTFFHGQDALFAEKRRTGPFVANSTVLNMSYVGNGEAGILVILPRSYRNVNVIRTYPLFYPRCHAATMPIKASSDQMIRLAGSGMLGSTGTKSDSSPMMPLISSSPSSSRDPGPPWTTEA